MQGEINQDRSRPPAAQSSVKPHDRAFALHKLVARLFPQPIEDRVEKRILEFLRNNRRHQAGVGGGKAEPLEVPVMAGRDNARSGRSDGARKLIPALEFDQLAVIIFG